MLENQVVYMMQHLNDFWFSCVWKNNCHLGSTGYNNETSEVGPRWEALLSQTEATTLSGAGVGTRLFLQLLKGIWEPSTVQTTEIIRWKRGTPQRATWRWHQA